MTELPQFNIISSGKISREFISLGINDFQSAVLIWEEGLINGKINYKEEDFHE